MPAAVFALARVAVCVLTALFALAPVAICAPADGIFDASAADLTVVRATEEGRRNTLATSPNWSQ